MLVVNHMLKYCVRLNCNENVMIDKLKILLEMHPFLQKL
jgi:hypothetical protein